MISVAFGRDLCRTVLVSPRRAHSREDHGFRDGSRRGALIPRSGETCSQALHLGPPAFPALVQSAHKIAESLSAVAQNGSLSDRKARHLNLQVRSSARGILLAARSQQSGGGHGFLTLGSRGCRVHHARVVSAFPWVRSAVRAPTSSHHAS